MTPRARLVLTTVAAVVAVGSWGAIRLRPPKSPIAARAAALRAEVLAPTFEALKGLHQAPPPPRAGDWLATQPEDGQSWAEFLAAAPARATPERRTLYVQPLGDFTPQQRRVVERTTDFVGRFFQLPVVTLPGLPASVVPDAGHRLHGGAEQVLTTAVLFDVLVPRRPDDALALVALTADDLYPAPDWNFVFGEASRSERVGVWSLHRLGEPGPALLRRTVQTATHELGHLLGLPHCVAFACVMNGSNSLEEADRQPLAPCPACLQKLEWVTGLDVRRRFEALAEFYAAEGFDDALAQTRRELAALPR